MGPKPAADEEGQQDPTGAGRREQRGGRGESGRGPRRPWGRGRVDALSGQGRSRGRRVGAWVPDELEDGDRAAGTGDKGRSRKTGKLGGFGGKGVQELFYLKRLRKPLIYFVTHTSVDKSKLTIELSKRTNCRNH